MNKWEHPVEEAPEEFRFKRVFFEICLIGLSSGCGFKILSLTYNVTYMWNLKHDTMNLFTKRKVDSQTQETNLWLLKGKRWGKDKLRVWD